MVAIDRERSAEDPVVVRLLKENLRASRGIDGANRFVGAAEGDALAVWRPGDTEQRIVRDRNRQGELLTSDIPNLHFAGAAGATASDSELLAIRREADRFNSLGHADQSS